MDGQLHERSRAAPAIVGLGRKSVATSSEERAAILGAVQAHRGTPFPLPVVLGSEILGVVRGRRAPDPRVDFWRVPRHVWRCGFTKYDDLINALTGGFHYQGKFAKTFTTAPVANNHYDLWPVAGYPQAGAYSGSAFTAVQFSDTTAGSMYTFGNVSTKTKHVLSTLLTSTGGTPMLTLYDRVLTYEACTFNASANQAMTNTLPAQRYVDNTLSGLQIVMTGQTLTGSTAANVTQLRYTNQAGTTLQSMPTSPTVATIVSVAAPTSTLGARVLGPATAAAALPWGPYVPLAVGDAGVELIHDYTTSAANTGTICFVLARPLFMMPVGAAGIGAQIDGVMQIPNLERIYDGACLSFLGFFPAATATTLFGQVDAGWN